MFLARFVGVVEWVDVGGFDGGVIEVGPGGDGFAVRFQFDVLLVVVGEERSVLA